MLHRGVSDSAAERERSHACVEGSAIMGGWGVADPPLAAVQPPYSTRGGMTRSIDEL